MIVMLGVAGSGKSTQSQLLAATGAYRWVYIGEVLRRCAVGKDAEAMTQGKLLNDDEVIGYLEQEIANLGDGPEIIIDGFPRTVYQADWLLNKHNTGVYGLRAAIHIDVSKEVVLKRLYDRGRPDDTEAAIAARFAEYDKAIEPVIGDLQSHGVPLIVVDGAKEQLDVLADITKGLAACSPK
jgi:adenylate kinase